MIFQVIFFLSRFCLSSNTFFRVTAKEVPEQRVESTSQVTAVSGASGQQPPAGQVRKVPGLDLPKQDQFELPCDGRLYRMVEETSKIPLLVSLQDQVITLAKYETLCPSIILFCFDAFQFNSGSILIND